MAEMQEIQRSLNELTKTVGDVKTTVAVMDERGKHDSKTMERIDASVKDLAKEYASHDQRLAEHDKRLDQQCLDIDELKKRAKAEDELKPKTAFEDGKKAGIVASFMWFTEVIKPYLIPAALALLGFFIYERQPTAVPVNAVPTKTAVHADSQ